MIRIDGQVSCECAAAKADDLVAYVKRFHRGADSRDATGKLKPKARTGQTVFEHFIGKNSTATTSRRGN